MISIRAVLPNHWQWSQRRRADNRASRLAGNLIVAAAKYVFDGASYDELAASAACLASCVQGSKIFTLLEPVLSNPAH